ncbi:putative ABC transport system ATP-binding protein [Alteromonadaceae bacterium 2753L.S.0a.02]|nr:putative ABC transport system ATP-binding protein [Alteromonadaceae bacterium 2753L.S.0a.02]
METKELVQLADVCKVYQLEEIETWALKDVGLTIYDGEYISICGSSGCGKSTLLSILGLLNTPTSGKYVFEGKDISNLGKRGRTRIRNEKIGFIFQAFNLIGDMSVFENVELPLRYRRDISKKDRTPMVMEALKKVGMDHRTSHRPSQLSGGQQQRVAIARAIVGNPPILFADEPTGNLDSKNAHTIMELLNDLNEQGSAVVMVTHDTTFSNYAKRIVTLSDGQIVDDGMQEMSAPMPVAAVG